MKGIGEASSIGSGLERTDSMPGMLKRTFDQVNGVEPMQGSDKENCEIPSGAVKRHFDQIDNSSDSRAFRNDEPPLKRQMINGDATSSSNGFMTNGDRYATSMASQELVSKTIAEVEAPAELFHVEQGIVPLSTIWERMSQEAHVELEELIADLANLPTPQINGYAHPRIDSNTEKKNKIWNFAHKWRANFIKLGVLTAWSTNATAVGKLIDISFWITDQRLQHRSFLSWMGELKRGLTYEKLPAPDLKAAMEVLSTGKAQWVSHMGYIPDKPLTSKQMLKSLKMVNAVLTIRLTTHQQIPYHLSQWTVKDGRVTFRVENEFELDLSIANEDPTSQFYFIDFRFMFLPSSRKSLEGRMKAHLEWKINEILFLQGLQECYVFLHEFVLEQKLTILRNQAREMIRDQWKNHTRLCPSNRGIVVQYWMERPGKKNWIEIGVSSGKVSSGAHSTGLETSHLSLRWHRHGVEVLQHGIEIDPGHLSLDRILNEIAAHHTNYIFKQIKRQLKGHPVFSADRSAVKHRAHLFDSRECSLKVNISRAKSITITQNAVTGMFNITPSTESIWICMNQMNSLPDPAAGAAFHIGILRCTTVLAQAVFEARQFGWKVERTESINNETRARLFKSEKIKYHFFQVPHWPKEWFYIAFTTSLEEDGIWLVELANQTTLPTSEDIITGRYQRFKSSIEIKSRGDLVFLLDINNKSLLDVEKHAALLLSQRQDIHWLQRTTGNAQICSHQKSDARTGIPQLYVKYPIPTMQHETPRSLRPWCTNTIKVCYMGLAFSRTEFVTFVSGQFREINTQIQAAPLQRNDSLVLDPARKAFMFRLQTKLGKTSLDVTDAKLERLGTLIQFLETTWRFGFICTEISLNRMTFTYSSSHTSSISAIATSVPNAEFTASISFPDTAEMRLSFSKNNPHLLIQDFLNQELNKTNGIGNVAGLLCNTLPLLQSLCAIRDSHSLESSNPRVAVLPRSSTSYQVAYYNKTVLLRFGATLRSQGDIKMHFSPAVASLLSGVASVKKLTGPTKVQEAKEEESQPQQDSLDPERLQSFWESLVKTRGSGWYNLGKGIICEFHSIRECLQHFDAVISDLFFNAANPEPEVSLAKVSAGTESNGETQKALSPQITKHTMVQPQAIPGQSEQEISSNPSTKPSEAKPTPTVQPVPKPTAQPQGQARTGIAPGQAAPQANMQPQPGRVGQSGMHPGLQNRPGNMNFKPGATPSLSQQPPSIPSHQRPSTQSFNAPQANMAQMRPGGGQTSAAPQANMQMNMHNKRQQGPNSSPTKKTNNGQSKSQPITLE